MELGKVFNRRKVVLGVGVVLLAFAALNATRFFTASTPAAADFSCPADTECPYDSSGNFIGYKNPWPAGCITILPGAVSKPELHMYNPTDTRASTTAPICRPSPVPPWRITYYERGHRMRNVGTYINRDGCAQKFQADGTPLGIECFPGTRAGGDVPAQEEVVTPTVETAAVDTMPTTLVSASTVIPTPESGPSFPVAVGTTFKYTSNDAVYYLDNGNCKKRYASWDALDAWGVNRGDIVTVWDSMQYPDCASPLVDMPSGK